MNNVENGFCIKHHNLDHYGKMKEYNQQYFNTPSTYSAQRDVDILLFFNKYGKLVKELQDSTSISIADTDHQFPMSKDPRDATQMIEYVYEKFTKTYVECLDRNHYPIYYYCISAFDTENLGTIFQACVCVLSESAVVTSF